MITGEIPNPHKIFVGVTAEHDIKGNVTPKVLHWSDGRSFDIDKLLSVNRAASVKAGGYGVKYTCRIRNKEVCLFYDVYDRRWFMEK